MKSYMMEKLMMVFTTLNPTNTILLAVLAIFAPLQPIIYGVLFLIAADTFTGIWAYFRRNNIHFHWFKYSTWQHITSKKFGDSIAKSLIYMLVIISAFTIGTVIMEIPGMYVTKFFTGAICLREIKSLIENGEVIMGNGFISDLRHFGKYGFKGGLENMFKEKERENPIESVNIKITETPDDEPNKIELDVTRQDKEHTTSEFTENK